MGPAVAAGRQNDIGSLTPGKLADLVVLDRDILEIPLHEIPDIRIAMTVIDGEIVFAA
jgi:predicted amidohydrolase YtcJ